MVLLFYAIYISVNLAHHEIFHAKVGKGGIILGMRTLSRYTLSGHAPRSAQQFVKMYHF